MKRRGFIEKVAGGGVGLGFVSAASGRDEVAADSVNLVRTPAVVMALRSDGAEVVWAVSRLAKGVVQWQGEEGDAGEASCNDFGLVPQGEQVLRVRLSGLKSGKEYLVRAVTTAGEDRVEGDWKSFRTLDPAKATASFVVWNDTHQNEETLKQLHEKTPASDFLLWNGDICNDWHKQEALIPTVLHPAGGDVSKDHPLMMVWGNHDVRGQWAFKLPDVVATPSGKAYYAFRNGPVAVVCLHTGEDKPDAHPSFGGRVAFEELRERQAEWLREVLAEPAMRDAPYRVVFCHIPLRWTKEQVIAAEDYGNGNYDSYSRMSREHWHDLLVAWGAQVVISGHMHQVAALPANDEFPYAQLVGGGPQPERATWIEGQADGTALTLVAKGLDGERRAEMTFPPLS